MHTNIKKSLGHGPTACQILHLVFFIMNPSIAVIIGRRPGPLDPLNPCADVPRATLGCSKDRFLQLCRRPKSTSKNHRFLESSKIDQNGTLNRPWCAQG